jgi:hypothetical protein
MPRPAEPWSSHDEVIVTQRLVMRRFRAGDEADPIAAVDDPRIAADLRDLFASPYTLADAREWIELAACNHPLRLWAVVFDGNPASEHPARDTSLIADLSWIHVQLNGSDE